MKKRGQILSAVLALALCLGLCAPALASDMGRAGEYSIIGAGGGASAAVDENGALWMWGLNDYGKLGTGEQGSVIYDNMIEWSIQTAPITVLDNVAAVNCGNEHTAAIRTDGTLWMWGRNDGGQLGIGRQGNAEIYGEPYQTVPVKVMDNAAAVSCGGGFTAAIKTDGSLWMWGNNWNGQLGNGTTNNHSFTPSKVMDNVAAVSCGEVHTVAIKTDGSLWAWGYNQSGQLGNGGGGNVNSFGFPVQTVPIKVMDDVAAVNCGSYYTAAIKTDGSLWMWGDNWYGQFGNGSTKSSTVPVKVMDGVAAVSCGGGFAAAIKTDGSLWMWGDNTCGQLGNGTTDDRSLTPFKVTDNVAAVSCGRDHTIAVKTDGTLWTWGDNTCGQLGNGGQGNADYYGSVIQTVPIQITLGGASMPKGVRLHLNGGTGTSLLWAKSGAALSVPTNPTRAGYTFGGWYTDEALTVPWNFNNAVTNGFALYAKWVPVSSSATTTGKSDHTINVNGTSITLDAYHLIADNGGEVNYVKLRDVAALLENTGAKFNVDWRNGAIYVATKSAYTTKNGTELKAISGADGSFQWNTAPVLVDGVTTTLEGIVITDSQGGGHTLFKLRDLGVALGFTVDWSEERGIYIETD